MKYIFLDIDGVFNTSTSFYSKEFIKNKVFRIRFDKDKIILFTSLLKLCKDNNIKICFTTSYSINKTVEDWKTYLLSEFSLNVENLIIGLDNKQNMDRGLFIEDFIFDNNISNYLIIDDDFRDIIPYHNLNSILPINSCIGFREDDLNVVKEKLCY